MKIILFILLSIVTVSAQKPMSELDHFKEITNLKFHQAEANLILQAKEYERRLEDLNGEAARLKLIQSLYLPRETFDATVKEYSSKLEALQKIVWVGIGVMMLAQFAIGYLIKTKKE